MSAKVSGAACQLEAGFIANTAVSSGLIRLDVQLDQAVSFLPGQFAMLNLAGGGAFVFSRPFSIFEVSGSRMSFLYRVVGRGTEALAGLRPGDRLTVLGPLGRPFPAPRELGDTSVLVVAGGVGLPPVHNWLARYARPADRGFFGGRDGSDIPWNLFSERWRVSVDHEDGIPDGRVATVGLVTDLLANEIPSRDEKPRVVLACGPLPMLRAVAVLAEQRGWACFLSLEEHMGCGYGVCKGCVVPVHLAEGEGWRNATCCDEGPVFAADRICWERYGVSVAPPA